MSRHLSPATSLQSNQISETGTDYPLASVSVPRSTPRLPQSYPRLVGLRRSFAGSHLRISALYTCLALVLITVGCKKKVGQGTISQPPIVVSASSPEVPAPESAPAETISPAELPEIKDVSPTPLSQADDRYRNLDLSTACSLYRGLWRAGSEPLPWEAAIQAVMACAVGSPEDQEVARSWLLLMIPEGDRLDEQELTLHIVSWLLQQLRQQVESAADREAKLEQLNKELENLKKIDARRRRP